MIERIIQYSINNKLLVFLFTLGIISLGSYSLFNLPIGAVPDITSNQVQVITTSRNLATEDVEKFLTYPIELEMANLPGVEEIRSVSKFGLSVVTIVFDEEMGTYLPRQLIAEKIKKAEERIPESFGKPFMGPISTGLGEIYQYIIDVEPEYQDNYTITELRTIQDWIVRRQLSGIPGVVEINTWGGFLKQYEVAINPEQLRAMNISLHQVYRTLQENNDVAGGGYIEKSEQTYFIRGEGLATSLDDIRNMVIENRDGTPVLIQDVAKIGFGHANRFGAITANAQGEKVLGQIMMLKGADSKTVIEDVNQRIEEIQENLPEGIVINGFLDRTELISRTTNTIAENLILGCLIVIFVVVLLLGNIRSGLIVSSIIPLCMLFALSLMYFFDVDANLMSLGAIDFGIIIDGAVIIVEFVAFRISSQRKDLLDLPKEKQVKLKNEIAIKGSSRMMRSALIGQLIVIIVFIPILSLVGVEGKMFRPMAMVFCFALIGAVVFCFTYVPVMASIFIKAEDPKKSNFSKRLMVFFAQTYQPIIEWALRKKKVVIGGSFVLLGGVFFIFSKMGGEFMPTLDEGDFVIQPVFKTGTSLSKTIEYTTQIEKILLEFPEVKQAVTRIGAAEVPTDPMSMEESDVIITLKPKSEWTTAETKDELANAFKEALTIIPGVEYEFTQPIEMRFNELLTGVRADLAIKIFGEDLDVLHQKALEIENAIEEVKGAADIIVEKVSGLPQMTVKYDRQKIAKYGLNIAELNDLITMGFAGLPAGRIFEGEKQFDLVVRYDQNYKNDIDDLEMASVLLPNGNKLPLNEFAEISYTKGPAKISRDDTKRRIVIGVNVRNRDLESVVQEIQAVVKDEIQLPVGYSVSYGGQFENLVTAKDRLKIAVPIALLLIFLMLYFAFHSVKQALLIYSAIPLATVGGVLLLYIRDMPFSISAGVGFIALFGVAVLNGIVLIEEFNALKKKGIEINKRIIMGTKNRLRPVLLTAASTALGFLPMAFSTSAGAEVQRPLATVVVGGLISATVLTVVVLPVLYALFDNRKFPKWMGATSAFFLLLTLPFGSFAQKEISVEEALEMARENNQGLKASAERVNKNRELLGTAYNINKTEVYYHFDENNIARNDRAIEVFGINQSLQFPTVYGAQRKLQKAQVAVSQSQYKLDNRLLSKEVSKAYYTVVYWKNVNQNYQYLDSLLRHFVQAAKRRYELGETNYLEQLTAVSKQKEVEVLLKQSEQNIEKSYQQLQQWMQSTDSFTLAEQALPQLELEAWELSTDPGLAYFQEVERRSERALSLEKQKLLPDIQISVFQGTNNVENAEVYNGIQAGLAIPLWFGDKKSSINAAKTEQKIMAHESENYELQLKAKYKILLSELSAYEEAIAYYNNEGNKLAEELNENAILAFENGEINYFQYFQLLENSRSIRMNYLNNLIKYDITILEMNYLVL